MKERRLDILDSLPGPTAPVPRVFQENPGAIDGDFSATEITSHMAWWLRWMEGQLHGVTPAKQAPT